MYYANLGYGYMGIHENSFTLVVGIAIVDVYMNSKYLAVVAQC